MIYIAGDYNDFSGITITGTINATYVMCIRGSHNSVSGMTMTISDDASMTI